MQQFETLFIITMALLMMKLLRSPAAMPPLPPPRAPPPCWSLSLGLLLLGLRLLSLLPWPQNACRWAKLPNLFHLRCKYNCGYVHVDDGDGGGSVRAFCCPFCSSCFCCCLFYFFPFAGILLLKMFRWMLDAKSAYLTPFADAVVFNLKGVLLLVTSASAAPARLATSGSRVSLLYHEPSQVGRGEKRGGVQSDCRQPL